MRSRHLPLNVPSDLYERIERLAEAEERTPIQQSVWLLKRALGDDRAAADTGRTAQLAPVAAGGDGPKAA